ncbi:MAG: 4Fe-4S ferredoxin [Rhodospirillaceae bacterium]|nr:4Fe-4S ferredoxin [Rhodospirillaceae bacterium]
MSTSADKDPQEVEAKAKASEAPVMSRRKWMSGLVPSAVNAVAGAVERTLEKAAPPRRRPPGAVAEPLFLTSCSRCGDCATACPQGAIYIFLEDSGLLAGTPVLNPDLRACAMCDGFPCAAACKEQALEVPRESTWPLGKVRIREDLCIAFKGPECGACVGLCPGELEAISLVRWKPQLDQERCVGCGICIQECPVMPKAIVLEPL